MIVIPELAEWFQAPTGSLTNKTKNGGEVVRKHDHRKPSCVAQPRYLEDLCTVHISGETERAQLRTFILFY